MNDERIEPERYEFSEAPRYVFSISRRAFVQTLGAGILITSFPRTVLGQQGRSDESQARGRFHIGADGIVTAYTGKVEVGQGARTQLTQAAAEELHIPFDRVALVMADTELVPNDGGTYGSQTTPRTVPTMRQAAAAAREALIELAANHWKIPASSVALNDGDFTSAVDHKMTLAELVAAVTSINDAIGRPAAANEELTPRENWRVLGQTHAKPTARAIVSGSHQYPSDIRRPGMLYGKVLRPPSYGATLAEVDLDAVSGMNGVKAVRDGEFVACAAPTTHQARQALNRLAASAKWESKPHPSSAEVFDLLKATAREGGSGRNRARTDQQGDVDAALSSAARTLLGTYRVPYIQHAPMEPRAAVTEWEGDRLTVWTATQRPFDVRDELARTFSVPSSNVHVIVPDSGGGFGGKHTPDAALEAARLAKAAGKPVSLQWTREEEFTWAYFRPAGVIEVAAALDSAGQITAWDFANYNSGGSSLECPYTFANKRVRFFPCESPLREGSYRALAATANTFAREAFIDVLAAASTTEPLAFRLARLDDVRLKGVLEAAAQRFGWADRSKRKTPTIGHGIACGTEKGSFVATCAEIELDGSKLRVNRICVSFDCGPVHNPQNLRAQIEGSIVMGLGGALSEAIEFRDGKITNARFKDYLVPRFEDVPDIDVVHVESPGVQSAGAGETPIIALAPAIANALRDATGEARFSLPLTARIA